MRKTMIMVFLGVFCFMFCSPNFLFSRKKGTRGVFFNGGTLNVRDNVKRKKKPKLNVRKAKKAGTKKKFSNVKFALDNREFLKGADFLMDKGELEVAGVPLKVSGGISPRTKKLISLIGNSLVQINVPCAGFLLEALALAGVTRSPDIDFDSMTEEEKRVHASFNQISVEGEGNKVEGYFNVEEDLYFEDADAELTMAIQNALAANIFLNGGTLILDDDLKFADNKVIIGPGLVDIAGYSLCLGGFYDEDNIWDSEITFKNATDIKLNGNIELTGKWIFENTGKINGKGTVIDMSAGGEIVIKGTTLFLENVIIRGIGDGMGKITFEPHESDPDSKPMLQLSGVTIELYDDYMMQTGDIIVDSEVIFILRDKVWTFDGRSKLVLNGRLNLDVFKFEGSQRIETGQVRAPLTLFVDHLLNEANVQFNILSGNLELNANGSVIEVADRSIGVDLSESILLGGNVTDDLDLSRNLNLAPGQTITVGGNMSLDGKGSVVTFSNQNSPQFIVKKGKTVTLKNISLSRINKNTFKFGKGSKIRLGQNVQFDLNGDLDVDSGQFILDGRLNLFELRGLAGKHKFTLTSDRDKRFNLRKGSLSFQNIEFEGLEHVEGGPTSSIVLAGNATVVINQDTSLNFDVERKNNELLFIKDAVDLSGSIGFFGDASSNILSIKFSLLERPTGNTGRRKGVKKGWPLLIFSGDTGVFLTADDGLGFEPNRNLAGLRFEDRKLAIKLKNENAFVIENNSFLKCRKLHILDFPMKQQSSHFTLKSKKIFGEGIDTSFIRADRSLKKQIKHKTAFSQIRMLEREELRKKRLKTTRKNAKDVDKNRQQKNIFKKNKNRMLTRGLDILDELDNEELRDCCCCDDDSTDEEEGDGASQFGPEEGPEVYDSTIENEWEIKNPEGNQEFDGGFSSRFVVEEIGPNAFDILSTNAHVFLPDEARLGAVQEDRNKIAFAPNQIMRFEGPDNQVEVTGILEFDASNIDLKGSVVFRGLHGGVQNPHIQIRDNSIIPIPGGTSFCSLVPVELGKQSEFILFGSDQNNTTLKFASGGTLRPQEGAETVYVSGTGQVLFHRGLLEGTNGDIYFNPNTTDNIVYDFLDSQVRVEDGRTIAVGEGTSSWGLRNTQVIIETGGTFAFNDVSAPAVRSALGGEIKRGDIQNIVIDGGSSVYVGGRLVLGRNTVKNAVERVEKPFYCKWEPFNIYGEGFVEYVAIPAATQAEYRGFVAKLQPQTIKAIIDQEMTFEKLAIMLTQKTAAFTADGVLHYEDENGNERIRTNKGISFTLNPGDIPVEVRGNGADLQIIVNDAAGNVKVYNENGILT